MRYILLPLLLLLRLFLRQQDACLALPIDYGDLQVPNGERESISGSQSSLAHTPLPIDVHYAHHDGYFTEHTDFFNEKDDVLKQARVIIAVVGEDHVLKYWQGSVNYVLDYNSPVVGDNMLEYWQPFEEILYVYQKFRTSCHKLASTQECVTEKVLNVGDSYYQFHFRGISNGLCLLRIIEMPSYGIQQKVIDDEKADLERFKNGIVVSISQNHFTPLMLMETSVGEIRRDFQSHHTALHIHEESILQFIQNYIDQNGDDLQDAFKAKIALQEMMKRIERFGRQFEEHTTEVITQTSDLQQKTLNMLEYSNICSGTFKMDIRDRVNLIDLCREAHSLFGAKANSLKSVGFLTRISAGRYNPYITTDSKRFRQALFAILQNSVQYSHKNGDPILFTLLMEGDTIRFICKDFGCGIDEKNLERVGTAFQSYDAMGNHQQSLGLGLFLTKTIVEAMGGVLDVQSDDGVSTTVEIRLPMSCVAYHQLEMESIPQSDAAPMRRQSIITYNALSEPATFYDTVIVSEDNQVPGRLLKKFVEKMGYKCELYLTGEAALEAFKAEPQRYFAAFLDFFTPPSPMRGSEVATAMHGRNPNLAIVIISANEDAVVRDAVSAASVQFLHKPFQKHKEELTRIMRDAYNAHHG